MQNRTHIDRCELCKCALMPGEDAELYGHRADGSDVAVCLPCDATVIAIIGNVAPFGIITATPDGVTPDMYDRDVRSEYLACAAHVSRYTAPRRSAETREVRVIALDKLMPETVRALADTHRTP